MRDIFCLIYSDKGCGWPTSQQGKCLRDRRQTHWYIDKEEDGPKTQKRVKDIDQRSTIALRDGSVERRDVGGTRTHGACGEWLIRTVVLRLETLVLRRR